MSIRLGTALPKPTTAASLGLTFSLEVGYRLMPKGEALPAGLADRQAGLRKIAAREHDRVLVFREHGFVRRAVLFSR